MSNKPTANRLLLHAYDIISEPASGFTYMETQLHKLTVVERHEDQTFILITGIHRAVCLWRPPAGTGCLSVRLRLHPCQPD